jgi:hypothetical protein
MWCVAPLEMNEGNSLGQGYNRPTGCSAEKAPHATFTFFTTEINRVTSLAQETTELQPKVCLAVVYRLLVANKGLSALPCANKCQGQLQTPKYQIIF